MDINADGHVYWLTAWLTLTGSLTSYQAHMTISTNIYQFVSKEKGYTVELQWLEHLWNHKNVFESGVVRANEC